MIPTSHSKNEKETIGINFNNTLVKQVYPGYYHFNM